jgi:phenylacetate-CoA ligase
VVCGTPSYLLYLAEIARKMGLDLRDTPIKKLVAAGEPGAAIPATKKTLEAQWGAECFDDIGSTEISNFGYECVHHQGTHVAEGLFLAEVLDAETDEALPDGEVGEMILSNLTCESFPLIRYRTRDLVKFNRGTCDCGRTNLRLDGGVLGRSDDMFQFAGVNVFPTQIQNLLHGIDEFSQEYELVIPKMGSGKHLRIRVEPASEGVTAARLEEAAEHFVGSVKYRINITPDIEIVDIGALPRVEGKAKRLIREA